MDRTTFVLSIPDTMVEKFENLINNINTLANGPYIVIEKKTEHDEDDIVAFPNGGIEDDGNSA